MANKMADKKKSASQNRTRSQSATVKSQSDKGKKAGSSQTVDLKTQSDKGKSASASQTVDLKTQSDKAESTSSNQTVDLKKQSDKGKSASASQTADVKVPSKDAKTEVRPRPQVQEKQKEAERKAAPREKKSPSWLVRLNNRRFVRFIREAYFELRHKVTWPTLPEARNMTIIVVLLSAAVGFVLGAVDFGLLTLFRLIHPGG